MPDRSRTVLRAVVSLVAALCAAVAIPAAAGAADYVAMGDSYSSGTGTGSYTINSACQRGTFAYPWLIQSSFGSLSFVACSGAKTQDVLNNQVQNLSTATKYVTISIGGNDAGFSDVITQCALPFISCSSDINTAQSYIANTLPGRLDLVYTQIKNRAPNAVVGIVGYPRLFNGTDCNAGTFFSSDEMTRLNQTADQLASVERTRAQAYGFTFIDARAAFKGHAVCDNPEWLNGLSNPTGESYHPNRTGHASGYASLVRAALQAAPKPDAPNGGNGRLAFTSDRSGNNDVWVMNNNGQFPLNFTDDPSNDIDPAWSPDGTKLAFVSNRDGDNEIYVANGDGSGLTQLTANTSDDREPAWSPNGEYIAFRTNRTGNNEIFRMTKTGASQTNLTNDSASDFAPDWSPDGSEIAFQRFTSGSATGNGNEVFKMNSDGQGDTNLTNNAASVNDGAPSWAPNGNTLAYHSNSDGDFEIFTIPSGGGTATKRTSNTATDQEPVWSPDGAQIAFETNRDGHNEIYTMSSTGGSQTNRSATAGSNLSASWQADSTPPMTTISDGPAGWTNASKPTFVFDANELGSQLQCKVDNGTFQTCTSPYETAALSDADHTFAVRAIDPAGNADPTPAVRAFQVDTVAPDVAVSCPATVVLGAQETAAVQASDARSGIAPEEDPSGTYPLDTSEPGPQSFVMDAFDRAGNKGTDTCNYEVLYEAPGTPALTAGTSPNAGGFSVGWAEAAPARYGLKHVLQRRDADDDDWHEVASGIDGLEHAFTAGDLADEGTWTYRVKGIDPNGRETPWSDASAAVVVDQTAPGSPVLRTDRDPEYAGDGGWFRDSVTVSSADHGDPLLRDGSDPSGVDPLSVAGSQTLTASDTVTGTVRDRAGNESAQSALAVQVDTEKPSLQLDCPDSVLLGGTASVSVTAADGQSGLADDPSGSVAVDTSTVGTKTIERTATDNVGHTQTRGCDVLVRYDYGGLRQPVNTDGSSVFKLGSTVPLKLTLADDDGRSAGGAVVEVSLERISTTIEGDHVEEVVTATPTNGKQFEYDGGSEQYRFNLSTKPLSKGTWMLRITLDDGTVHRTKISLS